MIDKVKNQLYSAQIFDKNGSTYTYALRTLPLTIRLQKPLLYLIKRHTRVLRWWI
jgi:hypothetical protein